MFQLSPQDLQRLTSAPVVDVAVDPVQDAVALRNAMDLVASKACDIRTSGIMASPCISVCRMTRLTGVADELCGGCFRTLDELLAWSSASNAAKSDVWQRIEQRIDLLRPV